MFLIATMAIVAFSATVAFAEEEQKTKGFLTAVVVTFGVYDQRCEKLPRPLRVDLRRILRALDKGDVRAGSLREQETRQDAQPSSL